jgi:hypothetical protein
VTREEVTREDEDWIAYRFSEKDGRDLQRPVEAIRERASTAAEETRNVTSRAIPVVSRLGLSAFGRGGLPGVIARFDSSPGLKLSSPRADPRYRIAILEGLARDENVNPRERIQAIRLLEEMRQGEQPPGTFEDLDEVGRRRARSGKPS